VILSVLRALVAKNPTRGARFHPTHSSYLSWMTIHIVKHGGNKYSQMIELRNSVLRKPLGLIFSKAELDDEKDHIHIGAFEDDKLLGCCMLIPDGSEKIRLRQMAVLNELQGKGIGKELILFAEHYARTNNYKILSMHARKPAVGFYQKLGYKIIGEEFIELNIPHYNMEKDI
jgi:predicted GNAT family N-acyltransferase